MKKVAIGVLVILLLVAVCGCAAQPVEEVPENALTDEHEARIYSFKKDSYTLEDLAIAHFDFANLDGQTTISGKKMFIADMYYADWPYTMRAIDTDSTLEHFAEKYEGVLVEVYNLENEKVRTTADEIYANQDYYFNADAIEKEVVVPVYVDEKRAYTLTFVFDTNDLGERTVANIIIRRE